ncbi:MAG: ATP-binding protein [Nitrospirae bacterium]|nr:ATP-binding protein [Nitrospirota bacterium]
MNKFINRKSDIDAIETEYSRNGAGFIVIYGRRRVGKTTLIKEFLRGKPGLYFLADRQMETELIRRLQDSLSEYLNDANLSEKVSETTTYFSILKTMEI